MAIFKGKIKTVCGNMKAFKLGEKEEMFNPLRYHLILDPYISSNSRQRKHTTPI